MSWTEKGKVISTAKNLVVRIKFGRIITFKNTGDYNKGDDITLTFNSFGKITVLKCEHTARANEPPNAPIPEDINYGELDYLEDLG